MARRAVLLLTGSSPTVARNAFMLATAMVRDDSSRDLIRRTREFGRRMELLYWRLARVGAFRAERPEMERLAAGEIRLLLEEEELDGPETPVLFDSGGYGLASAWRSEIAAAGRDPVILNIAAPVHATVAELCRDGASSMLAAQARWLRAHVDELSSELRSDGLIWTDRVALDPASLARELDRLGLPTRGAEAELRQPPYGSLPRINLHRLGAEMRDWPFPPILRQVQGLLKGGAAADAKAPAVHERAVGALRAWEDAITDARRERTLLRPLQFMSAAAQRPSDDPPFFILGAPRSGTTMLRDLLRQHPSLVAPEETFFFRSGDSFGSPAYRGFHLRNTIIRGHRKIDGIDEDQFQLILDAALDRRDVTDFYLAKFAEVAGRPEARKFDKTPQNVYGLPLISALYPNAPIVHIHRHPVEVTASARAGRMIGEHSLVGALNVWLEPMLIIEQCQPLLDDRLIELSIDELKQSPQATMRWLTERLGLPPHAYDLSPVKGHMISPVVNEALAREDVAFIEERTGHFMQKYGYGPYLQRRGTWSAAKAPAKPQDAPAEAPSMPQSEPEATPYA